MTDLSQYKAWAKTYFTVVSHAGEQAKKTGDKGWTALYFAGLAIGIAMLGLKTADAYLLYLQLKGSPRPKR